MRGAIVIQKNKSGKDGVCEKTGAVNVQKAQQKEEKQLPGVDSAKEITFVEDSEPAGVLQFDVWQTGGLEFINFCSLIHILIFKI